MFGKYNLIILIDFTLILTLKAAHFKDLQFVNLPVFFVNEVTVFTTQETRKFSILMRLQSSQSLAFIFFYTFNKLAS